MPEVTAAREDHRDAMLIGSGDDFRVILGPQYGQYINIRDFSAYAEWGDTVVYSTDRFELKLDSK